MSTFSSICGESHAEVEKAVAGARVPSPDAVRDLLEKSASEPLGLSELAMLLEIGGDPAAGEQFQALRAFAQTRFRKPSENRLRYIAPIYISSYCRDLCAYCNFSGARKNTDRKRLSLEGLEEEMATVLAAGPRAIELVLGTDPEFTPSVLARYVARTAEILGNEPGSGVLLCSEYLTEEAYAELREAGLWGMVQWDETLDKDVYRRWHDSSPSKREFRERIDNHDRALAAGLEVATGALFGLADFRYDALMQIAKARFLGDEYGRKPFVFGIARLKPIGGHELHLATDVADRAFETALMVYKIAEPAIGRWLQTRETFEMNLRNMLDGDVFTYRCGDVRPGGYKDSGAPSQSISGGQFGVHEMSRESVEQTLAESGFNIDYTWIGAQP
jgi:2-iminoacetate synthase